FQVRGKQIVKARFKSRDLYDLIRAAPHALEASQTLFNKPRLITYPRRSKGHGSHCLHPEHSIIESLKIETLDINP
ncbi:MAG: hypothetical protein KAT88_12210, partial [Spirochaetes bacterium]|nr:hypothetical protein [Spirochaetota bacterium]